MVRDADEHDYEDDVYFARMKPLERRLEALEKELKELRKKPEPEKIEEVKEAIQDVKEEIQEEKKEEKSDDGTMGNDDRSAKGEEASEQTGMVREAEEPGDEPTEEEPEQPILIAVATPEPSEPERATPTRKRGFARGRHTRA